MLKASDSSLSYDDAKSHAERTQKDVNLGIFEIARKVRFMSCLVLLTYKMIYEEGGDVIKEKKNVKEIINVT